MSFAPIRTGVLVAAMLALLAGCDFAPIDEPEALTPEQYIATEPLAREQLRAYPETVTRRFVSLADFENRTTGRAGRSQMDQFAVTGEGAQPPRYVLGNSRTGTAAMEATVPPGGQILFRPRLMHDLSEETLLTVAVRSASLRDDFRVRLVSDAGTWTSPRHLLVPGWNTVAIDIRRLSDEPDFDTASVREIGFSVPDAREPVTLVLDDVLLIDNRRTLADTPPGVKIVKEGLDYEISLPGRDQPFRLRQHDDGLWRIDGAGAKLTLRGADNDQANAPADAVAAMGSRRIGVVELAEVNRLRVRLTNTWYFPDRAGQWASMAVRRIRWEHTFDARGRWITHVQLNNAGGPPIASAELAISGGRAAWPDGRIVERLEMKPFRGPVARWAWLLVPDRPPWDAWVAGYVKPAGLHVKMGVPDRFANGDANRDRYDESTGTYVLWARKGHCRFQVPATRTGPGHLMVRVHGPWSGPVSVNCGGLALRQITTLADGSVLFEVPVSDRGAWVEVTGPTGP